jgi:hypothetical protein
MKPSNASGGDGNTNSIGIGCGKLLADRRSESMPQTITLNLPDSVLQPLQRTAQATNQPVESLLLAALRASLPALENALPEKEQK